MKIDWRPYDPFEVASNPLEYISIFSFDDYLTSTVIFLDNEKDKYERKCRDLKSQDKEDASFDLRIAELQLENFSDFENTLFSSFFVMVYSYLESELVRYCHDLEKHNPEKQSWSEMKEKNTFERAKKYLTKVQNIEFPSNSLEWEKIRNFSILRNCVVHNQGQLDNRFDQKSRKKLSQFVLGKDSKIKLDGTKCMLDREFCSEALYTIKRFLSLVATAKPRIQ